MLYGLHGEQWDDQLYVCMYPFLLGFPFHLHHHRALRRVPCAAQWVLVGYLFYRQYQWCVNVSPHLPIHSTPLSKPHPGNERLWFQDIKLAVSTMEVFLVHWLSHVQLFAIPWPETLQASLSFTISRSLLRLMSIESMMPSHHLILCHPLLLLPLIFPTIRGHHQGLFQWASSFYQVVKLLELQLQQQSFQRVFRVDFLGLTGLISLQSNGLSSVSSSTTVQRHHFFGSRPSLGSNSHICTWLLAKA